MKKEDFTALGISDELAGKAAAASAKELETYVDKGEYDTLTAAKTQLEKDVKARDKQIDGLKKVDPEKLQEQITQLQTQNANDKAAYEKQLKSQKVESAVQLALTGANALNTKAVRALLDIDPEKAEFDDAGAVKGLSDQIKKLQTADDSKMLFKAADEKPAFKGFKPAEGRDELPDGGMDDFFSAAMKGAGINNDDGGKK